STPKPTDPSMSSIEFVGLASDDIISTFLYELFAGDENKHITLIIFIGTLKTSLSWRRYTCPVNFVGILYKAPNQHKHIVVDPSIMSLFLDSSTSVHISNDNSDFFTLRSIPLCSVNRVDGSSIQTMEEYTIIIINTNPEIVIG
ncbi:hypothetical protein CY34DRAFT_92338, partial [Suillus luteus UH-Slu-Lm8-n1]